MEVEAAMAAQSNSKSLEAQHREAQHREAQYDGKASSDAIDLRSALLRWVVLIVAVVCMSRGFANDSSGPQKSPARIYRCHANGLTVFSDRPCASAPSDEVTLSNVNTYERTQGTPAKADAPKSTRSAKPSAEDKDAAKRREEERRRCRRIAEQLEAVGNKLRSGYTAAQDVPLHQRQRQLQDQQRELRCR